MIVISVESAVVLLSSYLPLPNGISCKHPSRREVLPKSLGRGIRNVTGRGYAYDEHWMSPVRHLCKPSAEKPTVSAVITVTNEYATVYQLAGC